MSINRVIISGNIGMEPELRRTASGTSILSLSVAVNDRKKSQQSGEWEDYTNWISCVMFGTRAQSVSKYLHKGNKVAIDGKLRYSSWERDGQRRSKLEVLVDDLELLTPRNSQPQQAPIEVEATVYDDSIPF